jgi:hypothetical protein
MSDSKHAGNYLFIDILTQTAAVKKYAAGGFIFAFASFAICAEIYRKSAEEKKGLINRLESSNNELKTNMNELKSIVIKLRGDNNELKKVFIEGMYESFEKVISQNINIRHILNHHQDILSEILQQILKKECKNYISPKHSSSCSTIVSTYMTPKKDDTNLSIVLPEILSAPNPYLIDKNSSETENEMDESYEMLSADKKRMKEINNNYFWK